MAIVSSRGLGLAHAARLASRVVAAAVLGASWVTGMFLTGPSATDKVVLAALGVLCVMAVDLAVDATGENDASTQERVLLVKGSRAPSVR